jgi:hypothetical protein
MLHRRRSPLPRRRGSAPPLTSVPPSRASRLHHGDHLPPRVCHWDSQVADVSGQCRSPPRRRAGVRRRLPRCKDGFRKGCSTGIVKIVDVQIVVSLGAKSRFRLHACGLPRLGCARRVGCAVLGHRSCSGRGCARTSCVVLGRLVVPRCWFEFSLSLRKSSSLLFHGND